MTETDPSDRLLLPLPATLALLAALAVGGWWLSSRALAPVEGPTVAAAPVDVEAQSRNVPLSVEVDGEPTAPEAPGAEPLEGACDVLLPLPELAAVSDEAMLDTLGVYRGSPLRVALEGVALTPYARGKACDDGFAHAPAGLVARPGTPPPAGASWSLSWGRQGLDVLEGPQGVTRDLLYVLPGTQVKVDVPDGNLPLTLVALATEAPGAATARADGGAAVLRPAAPGLSEVRARLATGRTPGRLILTSPPDGPVLVVHHLSVGEGERGRALLGSWPPPPPAVDDAAATAPPPSGPAPAEVAAPAAVLPPVRVLTAVPPQALVDPRPTGGCAVRYLMPALRAVSDKVLWDELGLKNGSPIEIRADGVPLDPHDRGEACAGGYSHGPPALVVRLDGGVEDRALTWSWGPPRRRLQQRDGSVVEGAWVPPGGAVAFDLTGPTEGLTLDAHARGGAADARVQCGDTLTPLAPDSLHRGVAVCPRGGAGEVIVRSPEDGPALFVTRLATD